MRLIGETSGSKSLNEEWFSDDLRVMDSTTIIIQFSVNNAVLVQYTLNSGTNWFELVLLTTVNKHERAEVTMKYGALFNMRTSTIGGTNVNQCVISDKNE